MPISFSVYLSHKSVLHNESLYPHRGRLPGAYDYKQIEIKTLMKTIMSPPSQEAFQPSVIQ